MLVKFKNSGPSTRIVFDIVPVQRVIRPGDEIEIDMHIKQVQMFERAQDAGEPIVITRIEGEGEEADEAERQPAETFTLRTEENPKGEPQSLKEALGRGKVLRPEPEANPADQQPQQANRIQHQAEFTARETDPVVQEPKAEPATATELLAAIERGEVSAEDQVRLAGAILGRPMPHGIKPATIAKRLQEAAAKE